MTNFRLLNESDFPLMLEWLSKPHIREWWWDGDDTLEKVALHYGDKSDDTQRFILSDGAKPIGYFQYYFDGSADSSSIGIDQFIGEEDYLDRGIGTEAVKAFVEMIKRERNPIYIILDPQPENRRAIRCYEKAGFRHYETIETEDGKGAYMMRLKTLG